MRVWSQAKLDVRQSLLVFLRDRPRLPANDEEIMVLSLHLTDRSDYGSRSAGKCFSQPSAACIVLPLVNAVGSFQHRVAEVTGERDQCIAGDAGQDAVR